MNQTELNNLWAIKASLEYGEIPKYLRDGWSSSFGLFDENITIENNETVEFYVSANGKLQKKCCFFKDINTVTEFKNYLCTKLCKKYPSIILEIKQVTSNNLNYRKKKALKEAIENDEKARSVLNKNHTKKQNNHVNP